MVHPSGIGVYRSRMELEFIILECNWTVIHPNGIGLIHPNGIGYFRSRISQMGSFNLEKRSDNFLKIF
jgi:hypothetical protein